jgi:hypothetical protein
MDAIIHTEPQEQLKSICRNLLNRQENVFEFQRLLAKYPSNCDEFDEPAEATAVREKLGQCVREWTGEAFAGFTVAQMQMWRAIVVDRRLDVAPALSFDGSC